MMIRGLQRSHNRPLQKVISNAVVFQMAWFACVQGETALALFAATLALAVHQLSQRLQAGAWRPLIVFALLGILGDSLMNNSGWVHYHRAIHMGAVTLAPIWLMCLWLAFITTLSSSLSWVFFSPYRACLVGVVAGPFSYYIGIQFSVFNRMLKQI